MPKGQTSKPSRAPRVRLCAYCDEPAVSRISPEQGRSFVVCEGHEERGIVDSGSGDISPLKQR
jgi:hypothetical protein